MLALLSTSTTAVAQDRIRLAEVLPALEGEPLGALDLGPAPPPGGVRTLRRAEIESAIVRSHRSPSGLAIPRESRIRRRAQRLASDTIAGLATAPITRTLAPCVPTRVDVSSAVEVGEGNVDVDVAEAPARPSAGAVALVLTVTAGGFTRRVPARVELTCPEPVVRSGARVSVIARIGTVRVTATGLARQDGRPGDRVRVRIERTGALVTARVLDAGNVEVCP
jgi:flagella basal body P-ring formation protein FlgA